MGSTLRSLERTAGNELSLAATIRWRAWPLVDHPRWSWLVPVGIVAIGGEVGRLGESWLLALAAMAAMAATLWQFLFPVTFEISSLGIRRQAFGRTRLVPWHAIRAYQLRTSGIVLFQRPDPIAVEYLRSWYMPNPPDEDELLCAVRVYLSHAAKLSL